MSYVWLALSLAALVAVALVLRIVRTPPPRPTPPPPLLADPPATAEPTTAPSESPDDPAAAQLSGRPQPGEIWRTSDDRRCVILRVYPATADVLWLVDEAPDLSAAHLVPEAMLELPEGDLSPAVWDEVRRHHRTGYSA